MSVIRIKKARDKPFVILDTTALNDPRLSFRAKGLHTYLMAKPDDWQVHIEQLEKQSPKEARDAIRAALAELEACGYIKRERIRGDKGRMMGWDTTVYETPILARVDAEDEVLRGEAIGLTTDHGPTTDYPTSVQPTSDQPTSVQPSSVQPSSANPQLLNNDSTNDGKELSIDFTHPPPTPSRGGEAAPVPKRASKPKRGKLAPANDVIPAWSDDLPWPDPYSLVSLYHALKPDTWSHIQIMSEGRLKTFGAYLERFPEQPFWRRVFENLHTSAFLRQELHEGNRTLDWLVQQGQKDHLENCLKVAEGRYRVHNARASPDEGYFQRVVDETERDERDAAAREQQRQRG